MSDISAVKILHVIGSARAEGTPHLVLHWLGFCGLNQEVLALRDRPIDWNHN